MLQIFQEKCCRLVANHVVATVYSYVVSSSYIAITSRTTPTDSKKIAEHSEPLSAAADSDVLRTVRTARIDLL